MASKVEIIGPFHWRERHNYPCEGLCESNHWWHRKYKKFPKCKRSAYFKYKGKQYCQIHMGLVLIKENMKAYK